MTPALHTWWAQRHARERRTLIGAAWILGLAVLWQWGLAPALHTLRHAPRLQAEAAATVQQLQTLAAEAQALQQRAPAASLGRTATLQALDTLTAGTLGAQATLQTGPDRVTATLTGVAPQAMAEWLSRARIDAHLRVDGTRLTRAPDATWSGSVTLSGEGLVRP